MIDPNSVNGISANHSQSNAATQQVSKQYSDFLRLLTTQLQNQDPTSPFDTNEMTQQIATLSQVEQQINTNKNLETLIGMITATQYNSVVSYIGKQVEANGNQGALENGKAPFVYYLAKDADVVDITIKNATGQVVYTGPGTKVSGRNEFSWDGKANDGSQQPDGVYTIEVAAKDASNNAVTAQVYTTGTVTSIDSVGGTVYASIGNILSIPLAGIISVRQAPPST